MKLTLIAVGKLKEPYAKEGCKHYFKRLKSLMPAQVQEVKESGQKDPKKRLKEDSVRILPMLNTRATTVAMTRTGRKFSSQELADFIEGLANSGTSEIIFIVGGPEGLAGDVLDAANHRLSMSKMTLQHELARLLLLEQLYRAASIMKGTAYHRRGTGN